MPTLTFRAMFDCGNAAFHPDDQDDDCEVDDLNPPTEMRGEIARILRQIADKVEAGEECHHHRTIFDVNGNDVGRFVLKDMEQ